MSSELFMAITVVSICLTFLFIAVLDVFLKPFYDRYRAWVASLFDKKEDD